MLYFAKKVAASFLLAVVLILGTTTVAQAHMKNAHIIALINKKVRHTHLFEQVSGRPMIKYWGAPNNCHHVGCWRSNMRHLTVWTQRAIVARGKMSPWPSWWIGEAACIHSHEGAWNDATGNGYYGGFQFLPSTWYSTVSAYHLTFQSLPNVLPPTSQLIGAYDRWLEDGGSWREWSTASDCGLS